MADPVSLAITVALTAAQMAIAASQHIEGPRLKDLSTTVADYGTPLNYLLGTCWVTGACFYAEPIAETVEERKGKGGKQTNYTYAGTFAIAVADQAVGSIRKIKFDGHLVYDATSALETYPLADDYALASHIRFYLGSAAQNPDPRMLATIVARDGAGSCPAYRGVSYIFFEDIPLEKLGNRLPIVTVEVSTVVGVGVSLDFKNGIYSINGIPRPVGSICSPEYSALGDFIVGGIGLTPFSPPLQERLTLVGDALSAIRNPSGFTAIISFVIATHSTNRHADVYIETATESTFTPYLSTRFRWSNSVSGEPNGNNSRFYGLPATGGGIGETIALASSGSHKAAVNMGVAVPACSIDGGAVVAGTLTYPNPAWATSTIALLVAAGSDAVGGTSPRLADAIIERIDFIPIRPNADLPGLSTP